MEQYNVTGMSCAACSTRVEKAVSKVPGVTSCSVSLLTNSMGVEGTASPSEIIQAVVDAGYGASPKSAAGKEAGTAPSWADDASLKDIETPKLKKTPHLFGHHPSGTDVLLHGPHDVGLAVAGGL